MPARSRLAASCALLCVVTACGGGDFPGLDENGGRDAGVDASLAASTAPGSPADSGGGDVVSGGVDAGCAAQFTGTVSAVTGQQYGTCAACVEAACAAVLAACFDDCHCGDDVVSFFGCLQAGGSLGACGVAVTADFTASAESLALDFVACASTCTASCTEEMGSPADAGTRGDGGSQKMDAGDSGARGSP